MSAKAKDSSQGVKEWVALDRRQQQTRRTGAKRCKMRTDGKRRKMEETNGRERRSPRSLGEQTVLHPRTSGMRRRTGGHFVPVPPSTGNLAVCAVGGGPDWACLQCPGTLGLVGGSAVTSGPGSSRANSLEVRDHCGLSPCVCCSCKVLCPPGHHSEGTSRSM